MLRPILGGGNRDPAPLGARQPTFGPGPLSNVVFGVLAVWYAYRVIRFHRT